MLKISLIIRIFNDESNENDDHTFDERFIATSAAFFVPAINLLICGTNNFTFRLFFSHFYMNQKEFTITPPFFVKYPEPLLLLF